MSTPYTFNVPACVPGWSELPCGSVLQINVTGRISGSLSFIKTENGFEPTKKPCTHETEIWVNPNSSDTVRGL